MLKKKALFKDYVMIWLNHIKIKCKKSTVSCYEYMIYKRIIPSLGMFRINKIDNNVINSFTDSLISEGLDSKTIRDLLVLLKQIFKYFDMDIKVSMPRVKKKDVVIMSLEDQFKLERALKDKLSEKYLGIYLCLYTGLRIGELCALKWENIDLDNKVINITKTICRVRSNNSNISKTEVIICEPKSNTSIRKIPIADFIVNKLKLVIKDDSCYFLTGDSYNIEPRLYTYYYKKVLKEINLSKDYNFHTLRHTFATRCIENGCDPKTLSELLGHSDVKLTLDRYVHPSFDNKIKVINNLVPLV